MTTPVNFETAKLLKEKGFEQNPMKYINQATMDGTLVFPTIAEVVMWLYEKHDIWISVQPNEPYVDNDWCFTIFKDLKNNNSLEGYNSPIESYESAIVHALTNIVL